LDSILFNIDLAFDARQWDLPEAAYFGPETRKVKGSKFAMNESMDGVVNGSRRKMPMPCEHARFGALILQFTEVMT
jgi:hypothetical protein